MRKLLLIRPNHKKNTHWAKLSETLVTEAEGTLDTPDLLIDAAHDTRTVVLIPTQELLITAVDAPNIKRQQLAKVVPFALEDQLNAPIDQQHFALGDSVDGRLPVCVIEKQKLHRALSELSEQGIQVDQCMPDVFALPWEERSWTILVEGANSIIRSDEFEGFAIDSENLGVILELMLSDKPEEERPERIRLLNATSKAINLRIPGIDVHSEDCAGRVYALFANHLDDHKHISLLSGQYSPKRKQQQLWNTWKAAAILAGIFIFGATLTNHIEAWQLSSKKDALFSDMVSLYNKTFPGSKRTILNPAAQMRSKFKTLGGGDIESQTEFLDLLGKVGPVLKSAPGVELGAMSYRDSRLDVDLSLNNLQGLDQLKQNLLRLEDIEVEVVSAKSEESKVRSSLRIKAKS